MSQRITPRRRMVDAIAVALAAAPLAVAGAGNLNSKVKPVVRESAPTLCTGQDSKGGLALQYTPFGWTLTEPGDDPKSACSIKATAANLNVLFQNNGSNSVLLETAPTFALSNREFNLQFVEPVLCESYYPAVSADLLQLRQTGPAGAVQTLRGISALNYALPVSGSSTSARLSPVSANAAHGPYVQCYAVPYSSLPANAPDVPAPASTVGEVVFVNGFETLTPNLRAELRIEILDGPSSSPTAFLRRNLTKTIAQPFDYAIRVRNVGSATANGLRVKEFVSTAGALVPLVSAAGWTCVDRAPGQAQSDPGTACGSGTGVLNDNAGFNLPAGSSRTYTLTRSVPSATTGQKAVLASAVFYDPTDTVGQGDVASTDNLASAVINLIENQAPTISCVSVPGGAAIVSPIAMNEDAAGLSYSCTLTDAESDPLHPTTPFVASSSNPTLITNGSLLGTPTGNVWPLTITPVADQSGTAVITFTATDNRNAQRQLAITVNVAEVNDAPSYDLFSQSGKKVYRIALKGSGSMPDISSADGTVLTPTVSRDANCGSGGSACSLRITNIFQNVDAGSLPEITGGQQVQPAATACDQASLGNFFFTDPRSASLAPSPYNETAGLRPSGSSWDLVLTYDKTAVGAVNTKCNFRFQDNGAPSPATSIDSPALTEIQFLGFAGS